MLSVWAAREEAMIIIIILLVSRICCGCGHLNSSVIVHVQDDGLLGDRNDSVRYFVFFHW